MEDDQLDLSSDVQPASSDGPPVSSKRCQFLGIHFLCCDVYARIYCNREGTAYEGNCPCCARRVRFRIGPGGTEARFFQIR